MLFIILVSKILINKNNKLIVRLYIITKIKDKLLWLKLKKVFTHLACEVCKSKKLYTKNKHQNRKIGSLLLHKFCQYKTYRTIVLHKEARSKFEEDR